MSLILSQKPLMQAAPLPSILFEDDHLLIVDKPADILTVPGRGPEKQDCVINRLLTHYPNARIVHRLDMATSGVLVIALSHGAQSQMSQLFANREVEKRYIAIVGGNLSPHSGSIDLPLICDWDNRPKQKVDTIHGKKAHTDYTLLDYSVNEGSSRVELIPLTGRSHQLRVHMQAIGHPILGDYFYAPAYLQKQSNRLLLHACELTFIHPIEQYPITITSPVPF